MSNYLKVAISSVFAVATLLLVTTGETLAEEAGCGCCKKMMQKSSQMQQSSVEPVQSYPPGYIRGK